MILFYSPLREALNLIPEKVRLADEIQVAGVSLKSTIKKEALRVGAIDLSETIPRLSSPSIDLLLRAPRSPNSESLISYTPDSAGNYESTRFPSEPMIRSMTELQQAGLIRIQAGFRPLQNFIDGQALGKLSQDFRRKYPGREEPSTNLDRLDWRLDRPAPKGSLPMLTWELTDRGSQAVEIILKAVSAELSPKTPNPN